MVDSLDQGHYDGSPHFDPTIDAALSNEFTVGLTTGPEERVSNLPESHLLQNRCVAALGAAAMAVESGFVYLAWNSIDSPPSHSSLANIFTGAGAGLLVISLPVASLLYEKYNNRSQNP